MERPTQHLNTSGDTPPAHACPKCQTAMFEAEVATLGRYTSSSVVLERQSTGSGLVGSQRKQAACQAWICPDCGYTEYYTINPRRLLEGDR